MALADFIGLSSFNSVDLFGSGPHMIFPDGEITDDILRGFAGVDGVMCTTLGGRGWPIPITGLLTAGTMAGLNDILIDIEAAVKAGAATLTYGYGVLTYTNVKLFRPQLLAPPQEMIIEGSWYWTVRYRIDARILA